jgi:hypothetical protein
MKEYSDEAILSTAAEEAEGVDGKLLWVTDLLDSLGLILFGMMILWMLLVGGKTGEGVFEME